MAGVNWEERHQKAIVRAFQLDVPGPKKSILMFPGWNIETKSGARCIHDALDKKVIGKRTQILCVERDAELAEKIAEHMHTIGLGSRTRMHVNDLHYLKLKDNERFDYAFFDFLGGYSKEVAFWIADQFGPKILDGADISITLSMEKRFSTYETHCQKAFETRYREHAQWAREYFKVEEKDILIRLLLILTMFRKFHFEYNAPYLYKDSKTEMIGFKLSGLQRMEAPADWPSVQDLDVEGRSESFTPPNPEHKARDKRNVLKNTMRRTKQSMLYLVDHPQVSDAEAKVFKDAFDLLQKMLATPAAQLRQA